MALALQQVEHGSRALRPVDHEGGVMLVGAGRHEAGHQRGEGAGIFLGGAADVGCSHGLLHYMLR